jgi:hypothetical protein
MSLKWEDPTVSRIRNIVRHPAYAGAYIYGMRHWRNVERGGDPVAEHRLIGQFVMRWDHHDGFISRETFLENQRTLALNVNAPGQPQLGPGPSLLQGRCRCTHHGAMIVHYHRRARGRQGWSFVCQGDYLKGGDTCVSVPGVLLEDLVVAAVLAAIDVPVIEEAHRLWRAGRRDWGQRHRGLETELTRKLERLDRVKHRLLDQEAGSPVRVRAMMEDEFEKLATEVEMLRQRVAREEVAVDPFTEDRWADLKRLCGSIKDIWGAPTTTDHDRKQLVRILVRHVVIEIVTRERILAGIEWSDGRPKTRVELFRTPYYHRLMWGWHLERITPETIVERLAELGARTQQGRLWSLDTVQKTLALMVKAARTSDEAGAKDIPPVRQQPRVIMFELHAAGLCAADIAKRLNSMGLLTRFGCEWSASSVQRVVRGKG